MAEAADAARARIAEIVEQMTALREERRALAKGLVAEFLDQLLEVAGLLSTAKSLMHGIAKKLPPLLGEPEPEEGEDEMSQLRSLIECVVADLVDPAIESLEKAAHSRIAAEET